MPKPHHSRFIAALLGALAAVSHGCNSTPPGGLADLQKKVMDSQAVLKEHGAEVVEKQFPMNQMCWQVNLNGKPVSTEVVEAISRLNGVGELILSKSTLTDDQMKLLGNLTPLYILDISETGVTDAGLAHLKQNTIAQLNVKGTKISPDAIAALEKRYASDPAIHPFFRKIKVTH